MTIGIQAVRSVAVSEMNPPAGTVASIMRGFVDLIAGRHVAGVLCFRHRRVNDNNDLGGYLVKIENIGPVRCIWIILVDTVSA